MHQLLFFSWLAPVCEFGPKCLGFTDFSSTKFDFRDTQPIDNMNSSPEFPDVESGIDIGVSPDGYDDDDAALSLGNLQLSKVPDQEVEQEMNSEFSYLQVNSSDYPRMFSPIGSERTSPEQGLLVYMIGLHAVQLRKYWMRKFIGTPKLDKAAGRVQFGVPRNFRIQHFLNWTSTASCYLLII